MWFSCFHHPNISMVAMINDGLSRWFLVYNWWLMIAVSTTQLVVWHDASTREGWGVIITRKGLGSHFVIDQCFGCRICWSLTLATLTMLWRTRQSCPHTWVVSDDPCTLLAKFSHSPLRNVLFVPKALMTIHGRWQHYLVASKVSVGYAYAVIPKASLMTHGRTWTVRSPVTCICLVWFWRLSGFSAAWFHSATCGERSSAHEN